MLVQILLWSAKISSQQLWSIVYTMSSASRAYIGNLSNKKFHLLLMNSFDLFTPQLVAVILVSSLPTPPASVLFGKQVVAKIPRRILELVLLWGEKIEMIG